MNRHMTAYDGILRHLPQLNVSTVPKIYIVWNLTLIVLVLVVLVVKVGVVLVVEVEAIGVVEEELNVETVTVRQLVDAILKEKNLILEEFSIEAFLFIILKCLQILTHLFHYPLIHKCLLELNIYCKILTHLNMTLNSHPKANYFCQ